jgi:hypothetical protein
MSNFKGILKYSSSERQAMDKLKKEKKTIKKIRRREFLNGAVQKLNHEIDNLYISL